jgi:CHAT domain
MRRDDAVAAIRSRIQRITSGPDGVLAPAGEIEAGQLADLAFADPDDVEAASVLGAWHWWRHHLLPEEEQEPERRAAVVWFTRVFPVRPDLVPVSLHSLVARIAEPRGKDPVAWNEEAGRLLADPDAGTNVDVLDRAVRLLEAVVADTPAEHVDLADRLSNLGSALLLRYQSEGTPEDLERALIVADDAVATTALNDPERAGRLADLGRMLRARYDLTNEPFDLDRTVQVFAETVAAAPSGHPGRPGFLFSLADAYAIRFRLGGALADLYRAVTTGEDAVAAIATNHPDRPTILAFLAAVLQTRYERVELTSDLDRAIVVGNLSVLSTPVDNPDLAARQFALGIALKRRYDLTSTLADLDRAIAMAEAALAGTAAHDPDRVPRLSALGTALLGRFDRTGTVADLDWAAELYQESAARTGVDHATRADRLARLARVLRIRFDRVGVLGDLDHAIELHDEAVAVASAGHPGLAPLLSDLGAALQTRFEKTGNVADLYRAITVGEQALAATADGDPELAGRLSTLGGALAVRFQQTFGGPDLERAITVGEGALGLTPADHPDRARRLSTLSRALVIRFGRDGAPVDLDRAISMAEAAVSATPDGHPERSERLARLSAALRARYGLSAVPADLDRSVAFAGSAVLATPVEHPDRGERLADLADVLGHRYDVVGARADLNEAVTADEASLRCTPPTHGTRGQRLCHLVGLLRQRMGLSGTLAEFGAEPAADLERAIEAGEEAIVAPPFPGRVGAFNALGVLLRMRFEQTAARTDLDRAVAMAESGLAQTAEDDPERARYLLELGASLLTRFDRGGTLADGDTALDANRAAAGSAPAPLSVRAYAGLQWASIAADRADWGQARAGWDAVLDLLTRDGTADGSTMDGSTMDGSLVDGSTMDSLPMDADRAIGLGRLGGVGTGAAAAALAAGDTKRAWAALEQGRALLFGRAWGLPVRTSTGPTSTVDEFGDMAGTVVAINVTRWRCDALIRGASGVGHLPLPGLTEREAASRAEALRVAMRTPGRAASRTALDVLAWLWDAVTGPVLDHLGHVQTPDQLAWPRIWWLPTGPLAGLPLHAAGHHDDEPSPTRRATVDRVVSSYAPSLRALAEARSRRPEPPALALIVGVDGGSAAPPLPYAVPEATWLAAHLAGSPEVIVDEAATVDAVRAALPNAAWAHFACHGVPADDPAESHLALFDGALPIRELAGLGLDRAYLAFLSGADTGPAGQTGEPVHVGPALHLAGFPHVVATLWPPGADLATSRSVYTRLAAGADPAQAVHDAQRQQRDRYPSHPYLWAAHVHIGP